MASGLLGSYTITCNGGPWVSMSGGGESYETIEEAKDAAARAVADDDRPRYIAKVIMKVETEVPPVKFTEM